MPNRVLLNICPMVMVSQSKTGNRRNRNWTSRSVWFCRQTYIYNFSSCRQWHSVALMMLLWWCLITLISDILININISAYFLYFRPAGRGDRGDVKGGGEPCLEIIGGMRAANTDTTITRWVESSVHFCNNATTSDTGHYYLATAGFARWTVDIHHVECH